MNYHSRKSVEAYAQMAEGFDGRKLIERLAEYLEADARVLEIGMGPGTDLDILLEYFEATGSDYSQAFLDRYRSRHPEADLLLLNAISLHTDRRFNALYSNKVLQHLSNDELALSIDNQVRILKPKGMVCHSFWRGNHSESIQGLLFNYHTEKEIEAAFSPRFDLIALDVYQEMEEEDSLLLIAINKI